MRIASAADVPIKLLLLLPILLLLLPPFTFFFQAILHYRSSAQWTLSYKGP